MAALRVLLVMSFAVFTAQASTSNDKTVTGASCANGVCGTHGYTYYWCTTSGSGWDYCCKPDHPCGYYGQTYTWCYNGYSWSYCQQQQQHPARKTVKAKDCRSGHACGTHGQSYNWCYTGADTWDYCCQPQHECAPHGEDYNWCYVGGGTWRDCDPVVHYV